MDEDFILTDEKLDELFVQEVISVTKIVEMLPGNAVISTCTRWFKVFHKARPEERFDRNCMLLLLHKQLNDHNTLGYPFTDERSFHQDLKTLNRENLKLLNLIRSNDDGLDSIGGAGDGATGGTLLGALDDTLDDLESSSSFTSFSPRAERDENMLQRMQIANQVLEDQNTAIISEIMLYQSEKERLLQERQCLHDKAMSYRHHSKFCCKEIRYMKNIFACAAITALKVFGELGSINNPNYFVSLFSLLCDDPQDRARIKRLDMRMGLVMRAHMDFYVQLAMRDQINRAYEEVRDKLSTRYKNLLKMQDETELHELSLIAMRCMMTLRKLFVETYRGDKRLKQLVLAFLQDRYNELAEEEL